MHHASRLAAAADAVVADYAAVAVAAAPAAVAAALG